MYRTLSSSPAMAISVSRSVFAPNPHANTLSPTVSLMSFPAAIAASEPKSPLYPRYSSCLPSVRSSTTLVAESRASPRSSPARFKPLEIEVSPSADIASIAASIAASSVDHASRSVAVSLKDTTEKRAAYSVELR